jgi:hypothetical protein
MPLSHCWAAGLLPQLSPAHLQSPPPHPPPHTDPLCPAALASNQLLPSLEFLLRHPEAMVWFLGLSAASCVVQLCISHTIKQYGALVFATIMTTRQFFSILLSSLVFAKPFSSGQWWVAPVLGCAVLGWAGYGKGRRSCDARLPQAADASLGMMHL